MSPAGNCSSTASIVAYEFRDQDKVLSRASSESEDHSNASVVGPWQRQEGKKRVITGEQLYHETQHDGGSPLRGEPQKVNTLAEGTENAERYRRVSGTYEASIRVCNGTCIEGPWRPKNRSFCDGAGSCRRRCGGYRR